MLPTITTWGDYRAKSREYDAVLEHAKAVAAALDGLQPITPNAAHGGRIFIKLLSHCIALRELAGSVSATPSGGLWHVASMSAVARSVVEAFDAFEYVAGHDVSGIERDFRIRLWELHDLTRQMKMHDDTGLQAEGRRLRTALEHHEFLPSLRPELRAELLQRIAKGEPPAFHLSQRQRCAQSGLDAAWHGRLTMALSQHAHTLPSSVGQLSELRTDSPEAPRLLATPLLAALPFLVRTTQAVALLMPSRAPSPPSRTGRTMAAWSALAEHGEWRAS